MSLETFTRGETKMTNPISKAIVKAAVAMGYGKKSDYKGSSVADVLEKFAAIAKDKGGSGGGGTVYATFTEDNGTWSCDKTYAELKASWDAGSTMFAVFDKYGIAPIMLRAYGDGEYVFAGNFTTAYLEDGQVGGLYFYSFGIQSNGAVHGKKWQRGDGK